ncbi:MAG TPA: NADH-quinone oxidoreductase subunit C, partial [Dehalococcoidia bacterium]|nr:NADH-quinone oxidoreductase subunit C [Dehalococcoidia bacterium]
MAVQALTGQELAQRLEAALPDAVERWDPQTAWVRPERIAQVCQFLRDDPHLDFQFLSSLSAVDFIEHFDLVYHLTS